MPMFYVGEILSAYMRSAHPDLSSIWLAMLKCNSMLYKQITMIGKCVVYLPLLTAEGLGVMQPGGGVCV